MKVIHAYIMDNEEGNTYCLYEITVGIYQDLKTAKENHPNEKGKQHPSLVYFEEWNTSTQERKPIK